MQNIFLSPPAAFVIVSVVVLVFAAVLTLLAFKSGRRAEDICKAYACGEDIKNHFVQPDYNKFFPFAFFFTVLHVLALILTTVPKMTPDVLVLALLYLGGAVAGLRIFFRKEV